MKFGKKSTEADQKKIEFLMFRVEEDSPGAFAKFRSGPFVNPRKGSSTAQDISESDTEQDKTYDEKADKSKKAGSNSGRSKKKA